MRRDKHRIFPRNLYDTYLLTLLYFNIKILTDQYLFILTGHRRFPKSGRKRISGYVYFTHK